MTVKAESKPAFEVIIQPRTDRYDAHDERWRGQVSQFYESLDQEVGGLRRETSAVEGTKGGVETVILALGSAGAFTMAIEFFRAWLKRDRTRKLEISWSVDGKESRVTVCGDEIDLSAVQTVAEAAAGRIGGGPWPKPTTEPS